MNLNIASPPRDLKRRLIDRMRSIAGPLAPGMHAYAEQLFSYSCIDRERLSAIELPSPIVGVVLHGRKEVWLGDHGQVFEAGTVFVLPRGVPMDAVNIPEHASGVYASLCLAVDRLPEGIAPLSPAERSMSDVSPGSFKVPLSADLVEALCHAAVAIANDSASEAVRVLRMAEVLTLLRPLLEARPLFRPGVADEVAWFIGAAPAEPWSVARMAEILGMGRSTLRRKLSIEGTSFRTILRREKLRAGRNAIAAGGSSLAAAEAAGYVSRSHFSRRFRESFGTSPTGRR